MAPLPRTTRLRVRPGVDFRATSDGGMLVDTESGACFRLNRTGVELWSHFTEPASIHTAMELLRRRYRDAGERIESDVASLCAELVDAGLLTPAVPPESPR